VHLSYPIALASPGSSAWLTLGASLGCRRLCSNSTSNADRSSRHRGGLRHGALYNLPAAFKDTVRRDPVFYPPAGGPVDLMLQTKQVVHVADLREEPVYQAGAPSTRALVDLAGARTLLVVPMLKEGELVGAISIFRQEVRPFSDKQINLLNNFASQAVIAIENVRLLNELRDRTTDLARSVEELRALGDVSQAVNSTLDLETVLSTIVSRAVQLSGTEAGAIYVYDDATREFRLRATYGMSDDLVAAIRDLHAEISDAVGELTGTRTAVQIADLRNAPLSRVDSRVNQILVNAGYRARLLVPLVTPDGVVGALVVRRKEPGEFPKGTVDLLQTFASSRRLRSRMRACSLRLVRRANSSRSRASTNRSSSPT
jgi:GAF domain-containing protein